MLPSPVVATLPVTTAHATACGPLSQRLISAHGTPPCRRGGLDRKLRPKDVFTDVAGCFPRRTLPRGPPRRIAPAVAHRGSSAWSPRRPDGEALPPHYGHRQVDGHPPWVGFRWGGHDAKMPRTTSALPGVEELPPQRMALEDTRSSLRSWGQEPPAAGTFPRSSPFCLRITPRPGRVSLAHRQPARPATKVTALAARGKSHPGC